MPMKKIAVAIAALLPALPVGLITLGGASVQERALLAESGAAEAADAAALRGACGPAPTYAHANPKEYLDSKETFYNATSKQTEGVSFPAGENVTFKCRPGYTADGSKDGSETFDAECTEHGYFKAHGVCLKASKCGPFPTIAHAAPTGKQVGNKVEFACTKGYSLDGEEVVNGGLGKNRFFELECIEFSGDYQAFEGNCTAYAFVAAGETLRIYNQLTEALFIVSCRGSLQKAFGKGETPSMDNVCSSFGAESAQCSGLVTEIKIDFEAKLAAREDHDDGAKKDWYEEKDADRPNIDEEAMDFCSELWQLLALPQ